jgi:hypothetical protein
VDSSLAIEAINEGERVNEEVCGEGVPVHFLLQSRGVEVLRDGVHVHLLHRGHSMEATTELQTSALLSVQLSDT